MSYNYFSEPRQTSQTECNWHL